MACVKRAVSTLALWCALPTSRALSLRDATGHDSDNNTAAAVDPGVARIMAKLNVTQINFSNLVHPVGVLFAAGVDPRNLTAENNSKFVEEYTRWAFKMTGQRDTQEEQSYILPRGGLFCLQAKKHYITEVLEKLQKSPMQFGWQAETSQVIKGTCAEQGYTHASSEPCYPLATMYTDDDPEHHKLKRKFDVQLVKEYKQKFNPSRTQIMMAMMDICLK
mmetsp:Transcript_108664/g.339951  ORF Transcript_108664/g.339951 Transcript_108664/m.339951 type:complete len:219 (+) Transcript_108664:91-747(+)